MLDGFIRKFVLCENCDNPETDIKVHAKRGILTASCRACGHNYQLDMRHKLATFILRVSQCLFGSQNLLLIEFFYQNPPEQKLNVSGTSLTERKDKKSKRDKQEKITEETNGSNGHADGNGNGATKDDDEDDNEVWATDTSEAGVRARMEELKLGEKVLVMDDDTEKSENEKLDIFYKAVQKKLKEVDGVLEIKDEKEILSEAERLEVENKAPIILCELLFSNAKILAQIKAHKRLFLRFTNKNQKAQKYLMGGIEKTIETHKDVLLPKVAHILKAFYDEDIIDEEVILEWAKKVCE